MDDTDRVATDEDTHAPARHDADLDTGHPAWVRLVTLLVLALFLLVTVVAALA